VASTSPAVTVCPTLTATIATLPATEKFTLAWLTASIVAVAETDCCTVPVLAAVSSYLALLDFVAK
jgi:hypothetical protein